MLKSTKKDILESMKIESFVKMIASSIVTVIFSILTIVSERLGDREISDIDIDELTIILAGAFGGVMLYQAFKTLTYKIQLKKLEATEAQDSLSIIFSRKFYHVYNRKEV